MERLKYLGGENKGPLGGEVGRQYMAEYAPSREYVSTTLTSNVCVSDCHVQLFATPWTVSCQAPLSMGFSKQQYWSE